MQKREYNEKTSVRLTYFWWRVIDTERERESERWTKRKKKKEMEWKGEREREREKKEKKLQISEEIRKSKNFLLTTFLTYFHVRPLMVQLRFILPPYASAGIWTRVSQRVAPIWRTRGPLKERTTDWATVTAAKKLKNLKERREQRWNKGSKQKEK